MNGCNHFLRFLSSSRPCRWQCLLKPFKRKVYNINYTRPLSTRNNAWSEECVNVSSRNMNFHVSIYTPPEPSTTLIPILMLPGALGTGPSDFRPQLEGGLGSEFQIIALDPRGIGGSRRNSSNHIIERDFPSDFYLRDAMDGSAVMKELGHSQYHVMGWSDGAISAIHLAANDADDNNGTTKSAVQKLVVWGGNAYVTQEDVVAWESLRDIANWSERMRNDKAEIHGGLEQLQTLNEKATDGWISMYQDPQNAGDVCLQALHYVYCPTLVVHGAKDVICDIEHARYIARQIASSDLVVVPEGKHNLHQRHADAFHQVVRNFLLNKDDGNFHQRGKEEELDPVIDEIAYAFMGSKSLFTALRAGVFDAIDELAKQSSNKKASFVDIEERCAIKDERLKTLLSACVALKLIRRSVVNGKDLFSLPKASSEQLVRSSKRYWGDYISGQVDAQFYSRMVDLDETMMTGTAASCGYETWFDKDPDAAKRYTEAQHNGSLATAYALHKRLPQLAERFPNMRMLDVGGGSGAFSIATARKLPGAECVVLDLANVTKVADEIIAKESDTSVQNRVSTLSLSAAAPDKWTGIVDDRSFDVALCSYVSGSIPVEALAGLYRNAYRVLKPGGIIILHDFFVDNNGKGPRNAALWALAHVTVNPEGMGLRPNRIVDLLVSEGFVAPKVDDLIPGATQIIVANKPATM